MEQYNFTNWLNSALPKPVIDIEPLVGECSQRNFFRVTSLDTTYILMQIPAGDTLDSFIRAQSILAEIGLNVPEIKAFNDNLALMTDFGNVQYFDQLATTTADILYTQAIKSLHKLNQVPIQYYPQLESLTKKNCYHQLEIFEQYFLNRFLAKKQTNEQSKRLHKVYEQILEEVFSQPEVLCHRDYHSKNLMVIAADEPGIIDFQDLSRGPLLYDLVSLLNDCYIKWPRKFIINQLEKFKLQVGYNDISANKFLRWFDFTAAQRHIKNLGTFTRLLYRDNDERYIKHLPRILQYLQTITTAHSDLSPLANIISEFDVPIISV